MNNVLVTGGAGFIGSNLVEDIISSGKKVVVVDNFTLGNENNLSKVMDHPNFTLIKGNVDNIEIVSEVMDQYKIDMVFHMAANSDIQKSAIEPETDFNNTFATTYSVLEGMRRNQIKKLFFASTSAVYGEKLGINLDENVGGLLPISYYGGAKMASEAFISAYAYMNDMDVTIFRFPNVIGPKLTHGVIFDFIHKLQDNSEELHILGNGTQCKPYIYVKDLNEVILKITEQNEKGVNIYNIGVETATTVIEIADMVCKKMNLKNIKYVFTEGDRGWKGDVPSFQYDLSKIHARGWRASYTSSEAVWETLNNFFEGKI